MDDSIATVEGEIAMLLRLAARPSRPSHELHGTLDRSAYLVLRLLDVEQHAHINAIADRLRLDASTVTRQVIAMESAGYVTRRSDPDDGRTIVVEPTASGLEALAETRAARATVYARVLGDWDPEDRQQLSTLLTRLNAALDENARRP